MRIKIRSCDGPNLFIPLPMFFLKSKILWRLAAKYSGEEAAKFAPMGAEMMRELSRFVKRNGHFTLVDVQSADGDRVKIVV